jgi:acyl-CoA hydrolase
MPTQEAMPDWARWLRAGDRIVCSHMTAEPVALLRSLAASQLHQGHFDLHLGVPYSMAAADFGPAASLTTFGGMGTAGALAKARAVQVSMNHYSQYDAAFASGAAPVDVALLSLARAPDGTLHLGAAHGGALAAARRARCVIAEVNAQAPVVFGAPWPSDVPICHLTETDYALPEPPAGRAGEAERQIAARVAPLVEEGACLQVGIGALPSAVLEGLAQHRGLGLHSGMLTPALWTLMQTGAIDNSRKPLDAGTSVAGIVYGDAALYRAVHLNAAVHLREPGYTHAAAVLAQLPRFTAINSALEVDLLGQMNAETVLASDGRRRQVGGVGGLNDFVRGAQLASGGRCIVALPARQAARNGEAGASRIVATLNGPATVAASDADIVATEHGVAHLRGASLEQRAQRLIAVAHPEDRDALREAARRSGQWP